MGGAGDGQNARVDDFEALLAEAAAVPLEGWDFAWFAGRATEERPSWGYAGLVAERQDTVVLARRRV